MIDMNRMIKVALVTTITTQLVAWVLIRTAKKSAIDWSTGWVK